MLTFVRWMYSRCDTQGMEVLLGGGAEYFGELESKTKAHRKGVFASDSVSWAQRKGMYMLWVVEFYVIA